MAPAPLFAQADPLGRFRLRRAGPGSRSKSELHQGAHIRAPVEVVYRSFEGPGRVRADRVGGGGAEPTANEVEIRRDDILKPMREDTPVLEAHRHFGSLLSGEGRGEIVTFLDRHFRRQGEQRWVVELEITRFVDRSTQKRARNRIMN